MAKKGRIFEEIVLELSKFIHTDGATVTLDARLPDKTTGQSRQIDILLELKNGPLICRCMIEVRDRSRPVGINYIEEVKAKGDAVGANKIIVVSSNGFHATAKTKAAFFGIETYSLEEALHKNWSATIAGLQHIEHDVLKAQLVLAHLSDTNQVIMPSQEYSDELATQKARAAFAVDLISGAVLTAGEVIEYAKKVGDARGVVESGDAGIRHRFQVRLTTESSHNWHFKDREGATRRLHAMAIYGEIWREIKLLPISVKQYRDESSGTLLAEVVGASDPSALGLKLVFKGANEKGDRLMGVLLNGTHFPGDIGVFVEAKTPPPAY